MMMWSAKLGTVLLWTAACMAALCSDCWRVQAEYKNSHPLQVKDLYAAKCRYNACTVWVSLYVCRARAAVEVVGRDLVVTPHLCALHQSIRSPELAISKVPLLPTVSLLRWQRVRGAARGLISKQVCSLCTWAVAPGKPVSALRQCCWPGWVLREKLSTKLLLVFSEMYTVWMFLNNLFLHLCSLQCDSLSFLSVIPKGIINPIFSEKTIWKNKSLDRRGQKVKWSFSNFCHVSFEIVQMTTSPAISQSSEQFTSHCSCWYLPFSYSTLICIF